MKDFDWLYGCYILFVAAQVSLALWIMYEIWR